MKRKNLSSNYPSFFRDLSGIIESARKASARSVNALMTAAYWEMGRRIIEFDQKGQRRAGYGDELLLRLSKDLMSRFGRGFSRQNLQLMRQFYLSFPLDHIRQTVSGKSSLPIRQTPSSKSEAASRGFHFSQLVEAFPLSWSHYVHLVSRARSPEALRFYHAEAFRSGWSVRQLDRQMSTLFYERTALSRNKRAMLEKGAKAKSEDHVTADEEIKSPFVLEFLGLKDEYSESDLEDALITHLESFLLELGGDFAFIGRQRRLRIDHQWYRVDLVFFHRSLKCLVLIDLKVGSFTHVDAGQMHLYLNYAREHWAKSDENPPVGLILCAERGAAVAKYALEGLSNKILASEYKLALPAEKLLEAEIKKTRKMLEGRK